MKPSEFILKQTNSPEWIKTNDEYKENHLMNKYLKELDKKFINKKKILQKIEILKEVISELEYAEYNVTETRISALFRIYKNIEDLKGEIEK